MAAILIELFQVGFVWVPSRLVPDLSRLDPIQGFRRIFSMAGAVRLTFGVFKILLVGGVAFLALYKERGTVMTLAGLEVSQIIGYVVEVLLWTVIKIAGLLFLLAILDYGFQWWHNEQDLRMTTEEVREEMGQLARRSSNPLAAA